MLQVLLATLIISQPGSGEPRVTVLDNGLTVITQELDYAPVVATVIAYGVGSRNESDGIRGISHFCEHMMFKGTPGMPKGRFWQIVQRDGGWANAFTSNDMTVYFLMLPSSRLEDALGIESDRMSNCLFDSAEVVSERNVIAEEWRMGSADDPDGALYEALAHAAFTAHPYMHPVIGYEQDILAFDRAAALDYYRTYYSPSNAVLAVVGDIDTEQALEMIEDMFGGIPAGQEPPAVDVVEPAQETPRRVEIEHESSLARVVVAFHAPAGDDPDAPLLDMLSTYLSGGRSGRLESLLVQSGLAVSAGAWSDGGVDPGLFYISATVMPGADPAAVEQAIWDEVARISREPVTADELETLKRRARASLVMRSASPLGLAMRYATDEIAFDDYMLTEHSLEAREAASADDLVRAASEWLRPGNSTTAVLVPTGQGFGGGSRDRQQVPVDMQEPSAIDYEGLDIPAELLVPPSTSVSDGAVVSVMQNGLTVMVKEDHTFPIVSISFGVPMGSLRSGPGMAGLAEVTSGTMMYGTEELGYAEFHGRLESRGAGIRFRTGREYATGSVSVLSEDVDVALRSVSDLLTRPAMRAEDFEQVLDETRAEVEQSGESVFGQGMENLSALLFGSREAAGIPTLESLEGLTLDEARHFQTACCRPASSVIVIVGDVDTEAVLARTGELFGTWSEPNTPLPEIVVPAFSTMPGDTSVVTMAGRAQAGVYLGLRGPGYASPDYLAFTTMNGILGSGIGSRLGHYVRDDQGLAYAVGSYLTPIRDQGLFIAYLSTKSDFAPRAAASVTGECARMADDPVDEIELQLEQASSAAGHALSFSDYGDQADYLVSTWMKGLPLDWDRTSLGAILELTREDIRSVARRYFGSGEWFFSFAGGLDENLSPLGQ